MTELDDLRARQEALEVANTELHEAFRQVDGDSHEALVVAKTNIRLITALRATQLEHGRVLAGLTTEVDGLAGQVGQLDARVGRLDAKIDTVDAKVEGLTTSVVGLQDMVSEVLRRLPRPPQRPTEENN